MSDYPSMDGVIDKKVGPALKQSAKGIAQSVKLKAEC
jgi:hypothetical protein